MVVGLSLLYQNERLPNNLQAQPRCKEFACIVVRRLTPKVLNAKASAPGFRITPHRKGCLDDTLISHSELCLVTDLYTCAPTTLLLPTTPTLTHCPYPPPHPRDPSLFDHEHKNTPQHKNKHKHNHKHKHKSGTCGGIRGVLRRVEQSCGE